MTSLSSKSLSQFKIFMRILKGLPDRLNKHQVKNLLGCKTAPITYEAIDSLYPGTRERGNALDLSFRHSFKYSSAVRTRLIVLQVAVQRLGKTQWSCKCIVTQLTVNTGQTPKKKDFPK